MWRCKTRTCGHSNVRIGVRHNNIVCVFSVNHETRNPLHHHPSLQIHLVANPLLSLRVSVVAARGDRDARQAIRRLQCDRLPLIRTVANRHRDCPAVTNAHDRHRVIRAWCAILCTLAVHGQPAQRRGKSVRGRYKIASFAADQDILARFVGLLSNGLLDFRQLLSRCGRVRRRALLGQRHVDDSILTRFAFCALRPLRPYRAFRSLRSGCARVPLGTSQAFKLFWREIVKGKRVSFCARFALRAGVSLLAPIPLVSFFALGSLRANRACFTPVSLRALRSYKVAIIQPPLYFVRDCLRGVSCPLNVGQRASCFVNPGCNRIRRWGSCVAKRLADARTGNRSLDDRAIRVLDCDLGLPASSFIADIRARDLPSQDTALLFHHRRILRPARRLDRDRRNSIRILAQYAFQIDLYPRRAIFTDTAKQQRLIAKTVKRQNDITHHALPLVSPCSALRG